MQLTLRDQIENLFFSHAVEHDGQWLIARRVIARDVSA
jgi:hypothetical protein